MRKGKEASGFSCQNCILNVCDAECLSQTGAFIQMFSQKISGPRLQSWDQGRTDTINGTSRPSLPYYITSVEATLSDWLVRGHR